MVRVVRESMVVCSASVGRSGGGGEPEVMGSSEEVVSLISACSRDRFSWRMSWVRYPSIDGS